MKSQCQRLFFWKKNNKNINLSSAELVPRVVKVNVYLQCRNLIHSVTVHITVKNLLDLPVNLCRQIHPTVLQTLTGVLVLKFLKSIC